MSKCCNTICGIAAMIASLWALPLAAQQTAHEGAAEPDPKVDFQALLRPPEKFEILGRFVGTWEGTFKVWMHGDPPPVTSMKDTIEATWVFGDSFLDSHFTNVLNEKSLKGRVTMGYHAGRKHFYRIYLADWDPRGTYSAGHYIRSKNALVFKGMEDDPHTGDSFEKRDSFTFVDKNKIFYEQFYAFADGSEVKVMEGHYTRVPGK